MGLTKRYIPRFKFLSLPTHREEYISESFGQRWENESPIFASEALKCGFALKRFPGESRFLQFWKYGVSESYFSLGWSGT
jgi:hypothetical protein